LRLRCRNGPWQNTFPWTNSEDPLMDDRADLIVTNANVLTLDGQDRRSQALAVKDERILAVGDDARINSLAGERTQRIDGAKRAVVPGLIDGHAHMDREGLKEALPSLSGCRSIADVLERIREVAKRTPPGEWIVTMPVGEPPFYHGVPENLGEGRFPDRHELDRVAPDHPVYIRAIWGHWRNTLPLVSVANTRALERAGIDRNTMPPAPSIQIEKELTTGEPTGRLYEFTFKPLVEKTLMACIPRFTLEQRITGLQRSMQVYNSVGTTSVFEGHGIASEVLAAYQDLRARGPLSVRSMLMFSPAWPGTDVDAVKGLLLDWGRWLAGRGMGDEYLGMAGLYTESDYNDENQLRALCGPYTGWAGFNFNAALPEPVMVEMMVEAARAGIRVGSFSPRILDLYEQVNARCPITDQRWIIEHVGRFEPDEVRRIANLGLVLQAYSGKWIGQDGERLRGELGDAGSEQVLPLRDLLDAGVHVSLATDNVPPTLFLPIWHAVARLPDGSTQPLGPGQRISRVEALACASREGAWLSFEEDRKGTLEAGKFADFAVLSDDPLSVDEAAIPGITADITVTGGRIVHRID
jgi:predicted amidohydrolase YtcJ